MLLITLPWTLAYVVHRASSRTAVAGMVLALIAGMSTAKRGDTAVMRQEAYQLAYVAVSAFCWTADVVGHTDG